MAFQKIKRKISVLLIVSLLTPFLFLSLPQKTEATYSVYDSWNWAKTSVSAMTGLKSAEALTSIQIKEYILDGLAWVAKEVVIKSMVASTVEWINSGFNGNPAFVTDPTAYFRDLADGVVGDFIFGSKLNFLCSPFSISVKLALLQQYYASGGYTPRCRLSEVTDNIEGAIDSLSNQWDWNTWGAITQNSSNNSFGSYIEGSILMDQGIKEALGVKKNQLDWGKGFLSYEKCEKTETGEDNCTTVTPGSLIMDLGAENIKIGGQELVTADEFNEITGALLVQLVKKVLGPEGLLGTSHTSYNNSSYLNQMANEAEDVSQTKNTLLNTIYSDLNDENRYLFAKKRSLDSVKFTKEKFEVLKQSCLGFENTNFIFEGKIYSNLEIETIIQTNLNPLFNKLSNQVILSQKIVDNFNSLKIDIKNTTNTDSLNYLINDYNTIRASKHSYEDIIIAENERDGDPVTQGIISKMDELNQKANTQINFCQSNNLKNSTTTQQTLF